MSEKVKATRCSIVVEMDVCVDIQIMIDTEMHIFESYLVRESINAENEKEYEDYMLLKKLSELAAKYGGILKRTRLSKNVQLEIGFPCLDNLCHFNKSLELEF